MDSGRQVIRWTIPGSVYLLFLGAFYLLGNLILKHSFQVDKLPVANNTAVGVAFLLITSIPLGFIIYQVYYYRYIRGRMFVLRSVVLKDRGADILRALPIETVTRLAHGMRVKPILQPMYERKKLTPIGPYALVLKKEHRTRNGRRLYQEARQTNWNLVRSYLDVICAKSGSDVVKAEYTSVSDIYHAQGASRISIVAAWMTYIGYTIFQGLGHFDEQTPAKISLFIAVTVLTLVFWVIVTEARAGTYATLFGTLRNTILWISRDPYFKGNPMTWLEEDKPAEPF
jgi:hypothetical protein